MFKRMLVAIDGSPMSNRALSLALDLANDQGCDLAVLHVVDEMLVMRGLIGLEYGNGTYSDAMLDDLRAEGRRLLDEARSAGAQRSQVVQPVLVDSRGRSVAHTILAQTRKLGADLIVMGTHGRRGLSRLVMGSDAEGVLREAKVPVLLVHGATRRSSTHRRATADRPKATKACAVVAA